jgi:hypothetical protein
MADKVRVYKLTTKQAKKASGLYKSGKGITTKAGLAKGLRKAKMPASGQAIINFLKSRRGAQVAQPFHKDVYAYMRKHKVGVKVARAHVMELPRWKLPRQEREAVKGLKKRMKAHIKHVSGEHLRAKKSWNVYYEVGEGEASPPVSYEDITSWTGQLRYIHEAPKKPSKNAFMLFAKKAEDRLSGLGFATRNFRLVHMVTTEKQAAAKVKKLAGTRKASKNKSKKGGQKSKRA